MSEAEAKLEAMGLKLPVPGRPLANYVPFVLAGTSLIVSGQLALGHDGKIDAAHLGKLGGGVAEAQGRAAALMSALNVLAQVKAAVGTLDRVERCLRLGGFINAEPGFLALAAVMNGASDLMVDVFGERGRHAGQKAG